MVGEGKTRKLLDGGKPNCFVDENLGRAATVKTAVVVHGAGTCGDGDHPHLGVVLYDGDPVAWSCLSDDEIGDFKAWCDASIDGAEHVDVMQSLGVIINCPPPFADPAVRGAAVAQMHAMLAGFVPIWLAAKLPAA
jgi:hypothetical protein